jgi:hypothetical protein
MSLRRCKERGCFKDGLDSWQMLEAVHLSRCTACQWGMLARGFLHAHCLTVAPAALCWCVLRELATVPIW